MPMQRECREEVVRRLQFAMAELEVISGIADRGGEAVLLQQFHTLKERVRDCINALNGCKAPSSPTCSG